MTRSWQTLITLMMLAPAPALAHGAGGHPADPALHVDATLKDCSVVFAPELTQSAYSRFVREFGSVSAFKMLAPPAPLGRGRFTIGIEQASFTVEEHSDAWNDTFAHPDAYHELGSHLAVPKLRFRVGVSDAIDLGAYYSENRNANYGWIGLEAKVAPLRQGPAMPVSLALRGAYTKTLYVRDMDMHAATLDVAVGRRFGSAFSAYAGAGSDAVLARETSDVVNLETEMLSVGHVLGGCELRFWHVALGAEAQRGALTTVQFQLSAAF